MSFKKNDSYSKGKRWGFAVMRTASETGKAAVMGVDKAMVTCAMYARSGKKKGKELNKEERSAYRGIADGIYEFVNRSNTYQRKRTSDTKKFILERYGSYDNYYRNKRETERLKKEEAYDFFYGDRDYR